MNTNIDENKLIAERRTKLDKIRSLDETNGHPNAFKPSDFSKDLKEKYNEETKESLEEKNILVSISGRIMAKRGPFLVIKDHKGLIQAYAPKQVQKDLKEKYLGLDIGDIIGVRGVLHLSGKGDLYVNMDEYHLLTKSLRPLPEKFHGLSDQELKYRNRYVDLIVNEDSKKTFEIRSQILNIIRSFLAGKEFLEVETPMLHTIPGGASAKPFKTYHNTLDMDMFLRIAPELFLKRLIVGGFNRVFEINRSFRNEGISTRHNPEFTMLELYMAYSDYEDVMSLVEELFKVIAHKLSNSLTIHYGEHQIDLSHFDRISMLDAVKKYNEDNELIQTLSYEMIEKTTILEEIATKLGIKIESFWSKGQVLEELFAETAEKKLIQPTFITEYPADISPLARRNDQNKFITDRFELFVCGRELANGFSELNDAEDQASRFQAQVDAMEQGDDEAMHFDHDYIKALEYGLPPTGGLGIGIDRLVMLFADKHTIRDVILFPTLRNI